MRLQLRYLILSWAVSCTCAIALAPPAEAQSFFQKLFGFGSGNAPPPAAHVPARPLPSVRFQNRSERRWHPRSESAEEEIGPPDSGGPYRTVCVRACDGYYFPLRHNAWRRNFASDVKSCRNACGEEARLFYYPVNGGSTDAMTDLAGRPYSEMPYAFAYRKALVSGCTCKPAPWSREEVARHQSYAAEAAAAQTALPAADPEAVAHFEPAMAPANATMPMSDGNIAYAAPAAPLSYRVMKPAVRSKRVARRSHKTRYARLPRAPYPRYQVAPKKSAGWFN
jgi:hypothetical protein